MQLRNYSFTPLNFQYDVSRDGGALGILSSNISVPAGFSPFQFQVITLTALAGDPGSRFRFVEIAGGGTPLSAFITVATLTPIFAQNANAYLDAATFPRGGTIGIEIDTGAINAGSCIFNCLYLIQAE